MATRTFEITAAVEPQPRLANSFSQILTNSCDEMPKIFSSPDRLGLAVVSAAPLECVRGVTSVTTSVWSERYSARASLLALQLPFSENVDSGTGAVRRSTLGSVNWRRVLSNLCAGDRSPTQRTCESAAKRRAAVGVAVMTCTPTLAGRPMATLAEASRRSILALSVRARYHCAGSSSALPSPRRIAPHNSSTMPLACCMKPPALPLCLSSAPPRHPRDVVSVVERGREDEISTHSPPSRKTSARTSELS
mmetsp:Transcript_86146/g.139757  ORF Transcript_86146/g.139757 Transcript_86146/m.139757 type:complete len:250 (-) Transcript_86146:215-964(-)